MLVALPKGTNTAKPAIKNDGGDDAQLWACNKWLLAHPASAEAKAITTRALTSANLTSEQIVSQAKAEADAMREKASREIALERRKTMDELKGEISGLAVEIASKVAEKEIGEKEHEALIEKFIDELGETK